MNVSHNNFSPKYSGHNYNFVRETGRIIRYIEGREKRNTPFFILSDHEILSDSVAGYISSMFPILSDGDASVFWLSYHDWSNFLFLGKDVWDCLLQYWVRRENKVDGTADRRVLLPDLFGLCDARKFYIGYIKPRLRQIHRAKFLFVIDLMSARLERDFLSSEFFRLIECLLMGEDKTDTSIIVIAPTHSAHTLSLNEGDTNCVTLRCYSPEVDEFVRQSLQRRAAEPTVAMMLDQSVSNSSYEYSEERSNENFSYLLPLLHLNTPAERQALSYIMSRNALTKGDISQFFQSSLLKPIADGGVAVTPEGYIQALAPAEMKRTSDIFTNGAKILMFQGPEYFLRSGEGYRLGTDGASHHDIFDLMVVALSSFHSKDQYPYKQAVDLLKTYQKTIDDLTMASRDRTRLVLRYTSQFILFDPQQHGISLFPALEAATDGYCDFLTSSDLNPQAQANAIENAQCNLGYIYDQISLHDRMPTARRIRADYYQSAAEALLRARPEDSEAQKTWFYRTAWHLYDANHQAQACSLFLKTAERHFADARQPGLTRTEKSRLQLLGQECLTISLAIDPGQLLSPALQECLKQQVAEHGGFEDVQDFLSFLKSKRQHEIMVLPPQVRRRSDAMCVYFCRADTLSAMKIVNDIAWVLHSPVRAIAVDEEEETKIPIIEGNRVIILGAPDSPGCIPRIFDRLDPEFRRIYQAHIAPDLASVLTFYDRGREYFLLLSDGPGSLLSAWEQAKASSKLDQRSSATMLVQILADTVLWPMLFAARDQVAKKFIDIVADRIQKRQAGAASSTAKKDDETVREALNAAFATGKGGEAAAIMSQTIAAQPVSASTSQALSLSLQPGELAEMLASLPSRFTDHNVETRAISNVCEIASALVGDLLSRTTITEPRKLQLSQYVGQLRNYQFEIDQIEMDMAVTQEINFRKLNELVVKLQGTLRNLAKLVDIVCYDRV